jgi:hypothetical protein
LKIFIDFVVSLEDQRMDKMRVLRSFEYDIGKVSQKGVEARFHIPDHLYLPGEFISEELFDRFVRRNHIF